MTTKDVAENTAATNAVVVSDAEVTASLSAGYNKVNPPEAKADEKAPAVDGDGAPAVAATTETPKAETPKEDAAAPDPWAGVPPIVRQTLEGISTRLGAVDTLSKDIKTTAGRVAAMQSTLATAKATAKVMENAPTAAQIEAAAKDPAEWAELGKDFPEWTKATEGYIKQALAVERAEILKQIPKPEAVDVDGLRSDVNVIVGEATKRGRQLARVDFKHPTWEQDVYLDVEAPEKGFTPDFAAWMKTQAPETQALADSVKADDAIKMLDMYYDHRKNVARKDKNQARLAANVAPKSAAGGGPSILPDEAGLSVGYQRMKRA